MWKKVVVYLLLVMVVVYSAFPLYWGFLSSIKVAKELYKRPPYLLVRDITLMWYKRLTSRTSFPLNARNSTMVALATVFLNLCFASMAAFSFTKFRFRGQIFFSRFVIFVYLFPQIILIIPLYIILKRLGLYNTYQGLIVSYLTITLPFSIWLLSSYFRAIPVGIEEAARIDGCSNFGVFWRIILPLVSPALVATALFAFIVSWNEFLYAFILASDKQKMTLPPGFYNELKQFVPHHGVLFSWLSLSTIPPLIFFLLIYRSVVRGLAAGAVKG